MDKKIVLVIGVVCGFGESIVCKMYVVGYKVVLVDIDLEQVLVVVVSFDVSGVIVMLLVLDVCCKLDFIVVCDVIELCWGGVVVLVNNVGCLCVVVLMEIIFEEWDEVIVINMKGMFFVCQVFGKCFVDCGYGCIINIVLLVG